jgi:hypothetical protein
VNSTYNIELLRSYLQSRREAGIVVMLTLSDGALDFLGDPETIIRETKDFRDILIYDPVNELYSSEDIMKARSLCNHLTEEGLISAAGAFGAGGEEWSEEFDPVLSSNRSISIHRYYGSRAEVASTVKPYKEAGKPMSWDESFRIATSEWAERCGWFRDEGVFCSNYYGLRSKALFPDLAAEDLDDWKRYFEEASGICAALNP